MCVMVSVCIHVIEGGMLWALDLPRAEPVRPCQEHLGVLSAVLGLNQFSITWIESACNLFRLLLLVAPLPACRFAPRVVPACCFSSRLFDTTTSTTTTTLLDQYCMVVLLHAPSEGGVLWFTHAVGSQSAQIALHFCVVFPFWLRLPCTFVLFPF